MPQNQRNRISDSLLFPSCRSCQHFLVKRLQAWFPTWIYCAALQPKGWRRFNRELQKECQQIREFDLPGQKWSTKNYPGGYTSYSSMPQMQKVSSTFMELERLLNRHAQSFAKSLEWDLGSARLSMTDCWINIMPHRTNHSLHLHPLSVISGTYYVTTPRGCPGLKFEDPRASRFMAAPPRHSSASSMNQTHVTYPAAAGNVILFESWLRHEVGANSVQANRISISFNYQWN